MDINIPFYSVDTIKAQEFEAGVVIVKFETDVGIDEWRAERQDGKSLDYGFWEVGNVKYFQAIVLNPSYLVLHDGEQSIEIDITPKAVN